MSIKNRSFIVNFLFELWYEKLYDMGDIGNEDLMYDAFNQLSDEDLQLELIKMIESF